MAQLIHFHTQPRKLPMSARAGVVCVGNFDGVHLGHQWVIRRALDSGLPVTLVTFEPHPREYFDGDGAPPRLTSLREKLLLMQQAGLRQVLALPFRRALATLSPEAFVKQVLVDGLGAARVLVGEDFRFGQARRGDLRLLEQLGAVYGYAVEVAPPFCLDGERVSSSGLRRLLAAGDLTAAQRWLGRPYAMCGRVVRGAQLGRQLGFPTANLALQGRKPPLAGVFVVRAQTLAGQVYRGVANLGTRPTVDGVNQVLEVHLLDVAPNLYGQRLQVHFLKYLRAEQRFADVDALKQQISADVAQARWCWDHELKMNETDGI